MKLLVILFLLKKQENKTKTKQKKTDLTHLLINELRFSKCWCFPSLVICSIRIK